MLCLSSMVLTQTNALAETNHKNLTHKLSVAQDGSWHSIVARHITQNTRFTYDLAGNMLTKTVDGKTTIYRYNAINQLVGVDHKPNDSAVNLPIIYDASGNMLQDPTGNHYQYDVFGQLIAFQNSQGSIKAHYQYYATGLRATKSIVSNATVEPIHYYYDSAQNAHIINETQGQLATSYLLPSGHMVRYIHDGQGNTEKQIAIHGTKDVKAIINDQGQIQQTYHYSPNGIIKPIDPQAQMAQMTHPETTHFSITENPFQYSGEYRDGESGLDYLRARYYNPKIQRFIQRDSYPLLNRYAYVNDNPIMGIDPSGHCFEGIMNVLRGIGQAFMQLFRRSEAEGNLCERAVPNTEVFSSHIDPQKAEQNDEDRSLLSVASDMELNPYDPNSKRVRTHSEVQKAYHDAYLKQTDKPACIHGSLLSAFVAAEVPLSDNDIKEILSLGEPVEHHGVSRLAMSGDEPLKKVLDHFLGPRNYDYTHYYKHLGSVYPDAAKAQLKEGVYIIMQPGHVIAVDNRNGTVLHSNEFSSHLYFAPGNLSTIKSPRSHFQIDQNTPLLSLIRRANAQTLRAMELEERGE
jgi:RHS repeat-associated protein